MSLPLKSGNKGPTFQFISNLCRQTVKINKQQQYRRNRYR